MAHGDVAGSDRDLAATADLVVAADGGAFALERWGIVPHLVVGDLDSLGMDGAVALERRGATVVPYPVAKDESDLELAVRHALERKADEIVLLGVFGGARLDHELANATLVADPAYRDTRLRAVYGTTTVRPLHGGGRLDLAGAVGSIVTLLPIGGDAVGVTAEGLGYALRDETLRFGRSRGLSNVVAALPASVSLEQGVLLVIEIEGGS